MSLYDNLKKYSKDKTAIQRLAALRHEMMHPLAILHGYSHLLARINLEDPSTFPKDYSVMAERVLQVHDDIKSILDALTSELPSD